MRPDTDTPPVGTDIGAFCRAVEAHLCRVNGGHLVRVVGPAFELVAGWAREGLPLRVVLHGVDRTIARLTAKGPRRRPVRIEFCEADVRDAADQWRRAVGVAAAASLPASGRPDAPTDTSTDAPPSRLPSLPRHLERVLVRLSGLAATQELPPVLARAIAATIHDVDACLDASRGARHGARTAIVERLAAIDSAMMHAATSRAARGTPPGPAGTDSHRAVAVPGPDACSGHAGRRAGAARSTDATSLLPSAGAHRWLTTHSR